MFIWTNGVLRYLWRAVDQHGVVLDILVQERRNATAAKRFFKRLLAGLKYKPRKIVTDGLRSYGVARREVLPEVRHRTSRYLNNGRHLGGAPAGGGARPFLARDNPLYRIIRPCPSAPGPGGVGLEAPSMLDTVPVTLEVEPAAAAALDDPATRARIGRLVSRVLQPAGVERLIAAMDALAAEAERRGLTDEILEEELAAYNAERRDASPPA